LQFNNTGFGLVFQKQKSCKLVDVKKLGNKLQDLSQGEGDQPWISHSSSHNQGFKYINLVSSQNHEEESDELLHRSWKTRTHQRSMVLSPVACTKKVDRDGVGDQKKEEKCLGALATAILANDCSDHDQDAKFPAWDDCSRDGTQGGSIQETSDSENSDFEVDSERERLGTEAMRTLLSNIEEFVDSSEPPLKQNQIYSKKETGTTRRILLDNEVMTKTPSEAPLKQTPVNHLPLQTKKVMQCEYWNQKKVPPSSSSLAAMDKTFPSAAPIYELPVECLQEPEGIRSSTELRQPTLLSANDAGYRFLHIFIYTEFSCHLSQMLNIAIPGSLSTRGLYGEHESNDAGWDSVSKEPFSGHYMLLLNVWVWSMLTE
jgi:hypothetical protein